MKDKIIQQDDHIILPKATLKRFSDSKGSLHVLSLNSPDDPSLVKRFPRSFHTQKGLYNIDIDNKIKNIETDIGNWNHRLIQAIQNNDISQIDFNKMKNFAIKLITLQFQRCIMMDDTKRTSFLKNKVDELESQIRYSFLGLSGNIKALINKKEEIFSALNTKEQSIRYFQTHYLTNENTAIQSSYNDFKAVILYIPSDSDYSFILPPSHFIGIDTVARVIINPRLSIGLYPNESSVPDIYKVPKEEADSLIPRTIESALEMPDGYKEIVGEESYLTVIENKINSIKKECKQVVDTLVVSPDSYCIDNNNYFELFMILLFLYPETKRVILHEKCFKTISDISSIQWNVILQYGFVISIISTKITNNSIGLRIYLTEEEALNDNIADTSN